MNNVWSATEHTNGTSESLGVSPADRIIELRLPAKREYLPVLRATGGVVAGTMSFNYDEIMHIRAALSEMFDLAIDHVTRHARGSEVKELAVRFLPQRDRLEILITHPTNSTIDLDSEEEEEEGPAVPKGLMDKFELGTDSAIAGMVQYRST